MAAVLKLVPVEEHRIKMMRKAGRLSGEARAYAASLVKPGITTREIDKALYRFIRSHGGYPNFYHLYGFKGSACMSINDEIIHGVPGNRRLQEGDIISIDTGACVGDYHLDKNGAPHGGFHGDCAVTVGVGQISDEDRRLIEVTERSFWEGIQNAVVGNRVSDISRGVQQCVEAEGFAIVREFVGHGIGNEVHMSPEIPNYVMDHYPEGNPRLKLHQTLAVEPMVNAGTAHIRKKRMSDGWEVILTADGKNAAHYENTILITEGEPEVLTFVGE
jgi:methionyl aminopeptidase